MTFMRADGCFKQPERSKQNIVICRSVYVQLQKWLAGAWLTKFFLQIL